MSEVPDWSEYRAAHPGARPTEWLRDAAEPDWSAAVGHAFARACNEGAVPEAVMRRYLVQDYQFIGAFTALLGRAIHTAPDLPARLPLGRFMGLLCSEENTYFVRSFDALGVAEALRRDPPLSAAARDFRALMQRAADSPRHADQLAVLCVAEWIYLSWARPARDTRPAEPFWCAEWVDLHASPYFEGFVEGLRAALDREVLALDAAGRAGVRALFVKAARLERAFFDSAYDESLPAG
ncbi:TenA family protein [Falsiroseomonas oryzae]|uniref:TenA family protein n=1 Tax=Falsiroseomonas oryzae TaxID=2766473 RepID=UPI0022EA159B|nr:TenA family protein [Roseomonas sp. MO-31]